MFNRLFPTHRLALLADRWVLRPSGSQTQIESVFTDNKPLPALESLLEQQAVSGRLRITLSHHHVRLFLAPPPPAWLNRAEMLIWIGAALEATLGEKTGWSLSWDLTPPGQPIIVAALPEPLWVGIHALCAQRDIKLTGVRPWLADAWQLRRGQLARATGWYAILEPGRQILLSLQHGQTVALRQRQTGSDPAAELDALLSRESLLTDLPAGGPLWVEQAGGWQGQGRQGQGRDQFASKFGGRYAVHEFSGPADLAQALLQ
jgi:hypothetical protein